ncbi:adenosine kinase [Rickettsiales bacterium]|nr:adenosine kinase [Rickettsiales bacterium]
MAESSLPGDKKTEKLFDVLSVGNAMVDILVKTNDEFLQSLKLKKGSMNLIDEAKAKILFDLFAKVEKSSSASVNEMSGGCAANVSAGISSFGGKAAFLGLISKDECGERFLEKLRCRDVNVESSPMKDKGETGRCLIIVTEDGARTMCTYLGSLQDISPEDIKEDVIAKSKIVFISAFLLDCKSGKEVMLKVMEFAKKNDCKIAITLSDSLCVKRHKAVLMDFIDNHVDLFFGNKEEINELLSSSSHEESVNMMVKKYAGKDKIAVLTCSKDGVIIVGKDGPITVGGQEVAKVVDTTGAGSVFVSGFLYAYTHNFDLEQAAKLGNIAAAKCLSHLGARPITSLRSLLASI